MSTGGVSNDTGLAKFGKANATLNTPSRTSVLPFAFKTYDANSEIGEKDQDFTELQITQQEFQR